MKINVIAPTVLPISGKGQKYGGIESVITLVVNELVKRGHEVHLFAAGGSKTKAILEVTAPKPLGQGVSFAKEKRYNLLAYKRCLALEPDVIWDNSVAIHAHKMGKNLSKYLFKANIVLEPSQLVDTKGIPVVHTLHGPAKDHMPKVIHDLSLAGHYFISISKDQARRYIRYIAKGQLLDTVYNPVDIKFYKPNYNKRIDNYFIWVGRYGMEKGPHIALAVAHRLKIPLKLIGKKAEVHEKDYFKAFIKPFLEEGDEVLSSYTPSSTKAKLYRGAKATLMTNLWAEPFGLVVGESMASGTPVIGPVLGSLSELLDSAGVLVPVHDLNLDENEVEVTISQLRYIDRLVRYAKTVDSIPPVVVRKRAEYLFAPSLSASGYEAAFLKAIYLKSRVI